MLTVSAQTPVPFIVTGYIQQRVKRTVKNCWEMRVSLSYRHSHSREDTQWAYCVRPLILSRGTTTLFLGDKSESHPER